MHRKARDYAPPPLVSRLPSLVPRPRRTAKRMRPSPRPRRAAKRPRPSPRPPSRRRSGPSAGNAAPRRVGQQALPKEAGSRPGTPVLRSLARGAASRARPGKSPGRGRSPFLVSAADGGGKKLNHFSSRRVCDGKSFSRSDVQKGSGPHRGRTLFTRRSVRRIFRHVHAAAKNDPTSFRRKRRKPGRGPGPFLEFPEDGGPHSAAFSYRWPLLSAWPPSGFGGELRPKVVDETSLTPRRARRPGVPPPVPTSPAKRAASPPPLAGRPAPRLAGPRKNRPPAVGGRAVFPYHSCAFGRFQRKWAERQRSSTTVTSPATMAAALPAISQSPAQTRAPARDAQA